MLAPRLANLRNTVGSSLLGPFVDRPSAWRSAIEATCSGTCYETPFELCQDSSYVFIVCVIPGRDVIIVYFVNKRKMGRNRDEGAGEPVVSMGAKM